MSFASVRAFFQAYHMEDRILVLDESSATVALAAKALGCAEAEIAKTMAFLVAGRPIVVVMAGDVKVDNHRYKECFHEKAHMLQGAQVEELTGHPIGGVCPFGLKDCVRVYLDESLKRFRRVYPACGSPNSAICLTLEELERFAAPVGWVSVTKPVTATPQAS